MLTNRKCKVGHIEVEVGDVQTIIPILTKNGYQCKLWQDGESMDVMVIEFVHPAYEGRYFVALDENGDNEDES